MENSKLLILIAELAENLYSGVYPHAEHDAAI